jgi:hypothetical protein
MNTRSLQLEHLACMFKNFLIGILIFLGSKGALASNITNIFGHCDVTEYARTGVPLHDRDLKVNFTILLSGEKWQIFATNANNLKEWETLTFDGVDTFGLMPYEGHIVAQRNCDLYGSVNSGNGYRVSTASYVGIVYPWLAFVFRPPVGNDTMTLPWAPASWVSAYGYRWLINYSGDNAFIEGFKIIRDKSLDLDEKGEFARLTAYPNTAKEFSDQLTGMALRNKIPNGFTNSTLEVREWANYSNLKIPKLAEIRRYKFLNGNSELAFEAKISLRTVTVDPGEISVPGLSGPAYVRDTRYAAKRDGRFFPYAEYTNSNTWKPANDPDLLAQADAFLKNGPKMGDYGVGALLGVNFATRRLVIWTTLILLQAALLFLIFRTVKRKNNK